MKKFGKLAALLLASAVLAGTCAVASAAEDRVLRLSILAPLTTIDPHSTVNLQDIIFHRQVFESLYHQNEKTGGFEPRIAESYSVSDDGTVYTFKLRKGVKFHNGDLLKASDCVFSFTRAQGTPQMRTHLLGVKKIYAPDDATVVFELEYPNAGFMSALKNVAVISERECKEQGDKFGTLLTLAGTGPYYLTSLQHDVEWTCNAFADYYRGEAPIKKLNYKPISQASAGLIAFESGELDWYIAPIANWDDLTDNPDYNTELVPANHISFLVINPLKKPLDDENLRKAMAYCVDKEAMNMACYDGYAQ
ncbi:MAG: ABC transporter substrate-binding protein, partial [Pyramidobacter sp.]|nr:ABC transporter substrate-binding protein [Pyramidobacter sp.]